MTLLLVLQLSALFLPAMPPPPPSPAIFQQAQQGPQILPSHRHGPHEGEPGAVCYRGETRSPEAGRMLYHCACAFICDVGAAGEPLQREADECETSCGKDQCLCHVDSSCDMPIEPRQ